MDYTTVPSLSVLDLTSDVKTTNIIENLVETLTVVECVVDAKTRPVNVLPRLTPPFIFSLEVRGCFCTHVRSKTEDSLHEAIRHHTHSHLPTMFRSILMGNNCSSSRRKGRQDVRSLAKVEF